MRPLKITEETEKMKGADAIIGKRKDAKTSSIDQTENAIQNILLQEMENLDGIMIATTNLTQNLDRAFERRFLYKIEFDKPDIDAKVGIWNTMMPALTEEETIILANDIISAVVRLRILSGNIP